jgi:hypothetical protein
MDMPLFLRRGRVKDVLEITEYQLQLLESCGTLTRRHFKRPSDSGGLELSRKGYYFRDDVLKLKQTMKEGTGS